MMEMELPPEIDCPIQPGDVIETPGGSRHVITHVRFVGYPNPNVADDVFIEWQYTYHGSQWYVFTNNCRVAS